MALRPDRVEHYTDLSFFMNETAERGVICTHNTGGSGAAMDDSSADGRVATSDGQEPAFASNWFISSVYSKYLLILYSPNN